MFAKTWFTIPAPSAVLLYKKKCSLWMTSKAKEPVSSIMHSGPDISWAAAEKSFFIKPETALTNCWDHSKDEAMIKEWLWGKMWFQFLNNCGSPSTTFWTYHAAWIQPQQPSLPSHEQNRWGPLNVKLQSSSSDFLAKTYSNSAKTMRDVKRGYKFFSRLLKVPTPNPKRKFW